LLQLNKDEDEYKFLNSKNQEVLIKNYNLNHQHFGYKENFNNNYNDNNNNDNNKKNNNCLVTNLDTSTFQQNLEQKNSNYVHYNNNQQQQQQQNFFFENKNYLNINEPEKMIQKIRYNLLEKEEKRRNELIARELKELKECTFQPNINGSSNNNNSSMYFENKNNEQPIVVKGFIFIIFCLFY
jgi:hypothetical protein